MTKRDFAWTISAAAEQQSFSSDFHSWIFSIKSEIGCAHREKSGAPDPWVTDLAEHLTECSRIILFFFVTNNETNDDQHFVTVGPYSADTVKNIISIANVYGQC